MNNEELVLPPPVIYDSLEALDDYLSHVRRHRERRRQFRLEVERLCTAISKVREEQDAAHEDGDLDIVIVLQGVLQEFEGRLALIQPLADQAAVFAAPNPPPEQISAEASLAPLVEGPASSKESIDDDSACFVSTITAAVDKHQEPSPAIQAVVSTVVPTVVSDEEIEAQKQALLTEIDAIALRWNELDKEGLRLKDKALNRPAALRTRALACSLARIQTQADFIGLHSHVIKAVTSVRDRMELARDYAGEKSEVLPFDPKFWTSDAERLSVEAWDELAHLYEAVAEAQEAWDWYASMREMIGGGHHTLVNAIGAVQQMLFRALEDYGGSDRLQGDLYGSLRDAASSVGFLSSLNAETTWEELQELGWALPKLYAQAQKDAVTAQEKREKEARKAAALQAILQWQQTNGSQAVSAKSLVKSREQLLPLLDACIAAGIPATNVQVRAAILNVAPILLNGLPQYGKFLEAVLAERKRKGLDTVEIVEPEAAEEEDLPDSQIVESKELVSMFTEGQKILILGGSARAQVADKLKQLLQCADVDWIDSKKGDRMNKFKTDIIRADIVVVIKKFASHEMTEKGRDWAKEFGKMFVLLPSGYGVNQIINQLYLQLVQPDVGKKTDLLTPKPSVPNLTKLNLSLS